MNSDNARDTFAIQRLNRFSLATNDPIIDDITIKSDKKIVSKTPLSLFKQCLVNNFNIRFKMNNVVWPKRNK